jgi:hypothetical protein
MITVDQAKKMVAEYQDYALDADGNLIAMTSGEWDACEVWAVDADENKIELIYKHEGRTMRYAIKVDSHHYAGTLYTRQGAQFETALTGVVNQQGKELISYGDKIVLSSESEAQALCERLNDYPSGYVLGHGQYAAPEYTAQAYTGKQAPVTLAVAKLAMWVES